MSFRTTGNVIFTNMYIYEDDTLVEVINKIKINIIKHISNYNQIKFEDLSGFLSTNWNYYNSFKLKEYIILHILDENKECLATEFVEKLSAINRQYTSELTRDKIHLDNIDFSTISLLSDDELVGGFDEVKGKKVRLQGYLEEFSLTREEADQLIMSARNIVFK